jgi:hypothetical protein
MYLAKKRSSLHHARLIGIGVMLTLQQAHGQRPQNHQAAN